MPRVDDQITEDVKITTLWGDFPKENKWFEIIYNNIIICNVKQKDVPVKSVTYSVTRDATNQRVLIKMNEHYYLLITFTKNVKNVTKNILFVFINVSLSTYFFC
jgi:hypothetical protein